jgi:hypothetical protein
MGAASGSGRVDHWSGRALDDQIILGHLLPRYQAAQEWQAAVRAASAVRIAGQPADRGSASSDQHGHKAATHAVRRWWRQTLARGAHPIRREPSGGACRN